MNSNSSVYMGDDGHYHDKPADWSEPAPQPTEEGDLPGVQVPDPDGTGQNPDDSEDPAAEGVGEKPATAKTRKQ